MTNAKKYQEVFGIDVDPEMCPTTECKFCPCKNNEESPNICGGTYAWWNSEYKGGAEE